MPRHGSEKTRSGFPKAHAQSSCLWARTIGAFRTGLCDKDHGSRGRDKDSRRRRTEKTPNATCRWCCRFASADTAQGCGCLCRVDSLGGRVPSLKMVVPARANQGNAVRRSFRQCRSCPRNCKRRADDHLMPLGFFDPGKVVRGRDPQARKPATGNGHVRTRRAGCSEALQEPTGSAG